MPVSGNSASTPTIPLTSIRLPSGTSLERLKHVEIVDQLLLPHEVRWAKISTPEEAFEAIKSMKIRGAPAIASLAALSIGCILVKNIEQPHDSPMLHSVVDLQRWVANTAEYLNSSRPTAVNLSEAMRRIVRASTESSNTADPGELARGIANVCELVWSEDVERNISIGKHGAEFLLSRVAGSSGERKLSVLTVCNTGNLATSGGNGTALSIIATLHSLGRLERAYYMATTPYHQGSRLTALELASLGIPASLVPDTAAASLIASGAVDAFVAGADRVAANGDTANKISTFQIALLCKHAAPAGKTVPVVIAAPLTTLDLATPSGEHIVIEQRPAIEACTVRGRVLSASSPATTAEVVTVLVTPEGTEAINPAFDVTPHTLLTGVATERGVALPCSPGQPFDLASFISSSRTT